MLFINIFLDILVAILQRVCIAVLPLTMNLSKAERINLNIFVIFMYNLSVFMGENNLSRDEASHFNVLCNLMPRTKIYCLCMQLPLLIYYI